MMMTMKGLKPLETVTWQAINLPGIFASRSPQISRINSEVLMTKMKTRMTKSRGLGKLLKNALFLHDTRIMLDSH